jgi:hypothetical protein
MANQTQIIEFTNQTYSAFTDSLINAYSSTTEPILTGFVVFIIGFLLYASGAFFNNNVLQIFAGIWFLVTSFSYIDSPVFLGTLDFIFFLLLGTLLIFFGISGAVQENKEKKRKYKIVDDYD